MGGIMVECGDFWGRVNWGETTGVGRGNNNNDNGVVNVLFSMCF